MSVHRPIVFLGLSIVAEEAQAILDADCREPIQRGDLEKISAPRTVVIIDGVLDDETRIRSAEVETALRRGLTVYGASSTGALLSIELEKAGMKGVGRVLEFLRVYGGDREELVSVLYDARNGVTLPLVNVVLTCRDLGFTVEECCEFAELLSVIPLHDRNRDSIVSTLRAAGVTLPRTLSITDAKAGDAGELLRTFSTSFPRPHCDANCGPSSTLADPAVGAAPSGPGIDASS